MHYWTSYCALQALGVPKPAAARPPGPGRQNNLSNSALVGLLILILTQMPGPAGIFNI